MKRSFTMLLQTVVVLIGIGALALLLWEPQIEGANAHASNVEIYFKDPFLTVVYLGSIPFFAALYQAFKVLRYVGHNNVVSPEAVKALRAIKYCAVAIIGFVVAEEIFIMVHHGSDDPAGGVFMGALITFGSIVVVTATAIFERVLQNGLKV
jgi:hypothetical protein